MIDFSIELAPRNEFNAFQGDQYNTAIRFRCPVIIKDKIIYDLDQICKDDNIMALILETSMLLPQNVEVTLSDVHVWKQYSLIIENGMCFGHTFDMIRFFDDYRKVEELSEDANCDDSFASANSNFVSEVEKLKGKAGKYDKTKVKSECVIS